LLGKKGYVVVVVVFGGTESLAEFSLLENMVGVPTSQ